MSAANAKLAIIGGTGLTSITGLTIIRKEMVNTPWGEPSGPVTHGRLFGKEVTFLARHGYAHTIPPHKVNYRANIWALKDIGVKRIVSVAAVGGTACLSRADHRLHLRPRPHLFRRWAGQRGARGL
jgi:5'-methylthioinosine phosphorylase